MYNSYHELSSKEQLSKVVEMQKNFFTVYLIIRNMIETEE